ncbi:hypothetical protein BKA93DRAFT_754073 [Sparassis latifolia]
MGPGEMDEMNGKLSISANRRSARSRRTAVMQACQCRGRRAGRVRAAVARRDPEMVGGWAARPVWIPRRNSAVPLARRVGFTWILYACSWSRRVLAGRRRAHSLHDPDPDSLGHRSHWIVSSGCNYAPERSHNRIHVLGVCANYMCYHDIAACGRHGVQDAGCTLESPLEVPVRDASGLWKVIPDAVLMSRWTRRRRLDTIRRIRDVWSSVVLLPACHPWNERCNATKFGQLDLKDPRPQKTVAGHYALIRPCARSHRNEFKGGSDERNHVERRTYSISDVRRAWSWSSDPKTLLRHAAGGLRNLHPGVLMSSRRRPILVVRQEGGCPNARSLETNGEDLLADGPEVDTLELKEHRCVSSPSGTLYRNQRLSVPVLSMHHCCISGSLSGPRCLERKLTVISLTTSGDWTHGVWTTSRALVKNLAADMQPRCRAILAFSVLLSAQFCCPRFCFSAQRKPLASGTSDIDGGFEFALIQEPSHTAALRVGALLIKQSEDLQDRDQRKTVAKLGGQSRWAFSPFQTMI